MMAIQFRSSLYLTLIVSVLAVACANKSDQSKYHNLYDLLGEFPTPPTLQLDTLTDTQKRLSSEHANDTKAIEAYVRTEYEKRNASDSFAALYFDGGHAFPVEIRERAYKWLDQHLKPSLLTNK